MRNLLIVVFSLFCISSSAQKEWLSIGKTNKGYDIYLKSEYVSRGVFDTHLDVIKIWSKFIIPKKTIDGVTYTDVSDLNLFGVDMKTKELGIIQVASYTSTGKLIKFSNVQDYRVDWSVPVPGSAGDKIIKSVLDLFND